MFHAAVLSQALAGKIALRLAGFELKIIRPTCWMYHVPVFFT